MNNNQLDRETELLLGGTFRTATVVNLVDCCLTALPEGAVYVWEHNMSFALR